MVNEVPNGLNYKTLSSVCCDEDRAKKAEAEQLWCEVSFFISSFLLFVEMRRRGKASVSILSWLKVFCMFHFVLFLRAPTHNKSRQTWKQFSPSQSGPWYWASLYSKVAFSYFLLQGSQNICIIVSKLFTS